MDAFRHGLGLPVEGASCFFIAPKKDLGLGGSRRELAEADKCGVCIQLFCKLADDVAERGGLTATDIENVEKQIASAVAEQGKVAAADFADMDEIALNFRRRGIHGLASHKCVRRSGENAIRAIEDAVGIKQSRHSDGDAVLMGELAETDRFCELREAVRLTGPAEIVLIAIRIVGVVFCRRAGAHHATAADLLECFENGLVARDVVDLAVLEIVAVGGVILRPPRVTDPIGRLVFADEDAAFLRIHQVEDFELRASFLRKGKPLGGQARITHARAAMCGDDAGTFLREVAGEMRADKAARAGDDNWAVSAQCCHTFGK